MNTIKIEQEWKSGFYSNQHKQYAILPRNSSYKIDVKRTINQAFKNATGQ